MTSNSTKCFITPPISPSPIVENEVKNISKKIKSSSYVYPSYKRKQPYNLRIKTSNISGNHSKISSSNGVQPASRPENGKLNQKCTSGREKETDKMEKIMETTNLVCSFLKTICINLPVDDNTLPSVSAENDKKNKKMVSIENFVANILIRTKLTDTFVLVALLYIHKYLNKLAELEEARKKRMGSLAFKNIPKKILVAKRNIVKSNHPSHHSKIHHASNIISKGNSRIRITQQSLDQLYQQYNSNSTSSLSSCTIEMITTQKASLIKTQKDLIFAAMICSSKYLDDNSYCNSAWVKLTDKTLKEVFDLEREFLMTLDYKLYFTNEEWKEWYIWINHFKVLLDSGMASNPDDNIASPSCIISVPSQSSSSCTTPVAATSPYYPDVSFAATTSKNYLPSPVDIQTPVSTIIPPPPSSTSSSSSSSSISKTPFICFEEEENCQERCSRLLNNYPVTTQQTFLPSLNTIQPAFMDCCHSYPSMSPEYSSVVSNPYLFVSSKNNAAGQQCLYHQSFTKSNEIPNNYTGMNMIPNSQYIRSNMESFPLQSSYFLPYQALKKANQQLEFTSNTIDTSLLNHSFFNIDLREIEEMSLKCGAQYKKPSFPPCNNYY